MISSVFSRALVRLGPEDLKNGGPEPGTLVETCLNPSELQKLEALCPGDLDRPAASPSIAGQAGAVGWFDAATSSSGWRGKVRRR